MQIINVLHLKFGPVKIAVTIESTGVVLYLKVWTLVGLLRIVFISLVIQLILRLLQNKSLITVVNL